MSGMELFAANRATTTVSSGGTTAPSPGTVETWTVASSAMFGAAVSGVSQFHVADVVNPTEIIAVTTVSGTTWTVTRGTEGTTPVTHSAGFVIYQVATTGALNQLQSTDWINVVTQFGADPTGVADSTTAIQNALDALPAGGGCVYLPSGTYMVTSTLTYTGLYGYIRGDGRWATQISYTGSGDCLRIYYADTTGVITGGGVLDLTIDGTSASAGACGLHYGDMRAGELRLAVRSFFGTGSIGVHLDNQYAWTEECHGYLWLSSNKQSLVLDVSAPPGGAYTATNASPCVFTCSSPAFTNGTRVVLSGGTAPTGFTNGTAYFVVNASGTTFQLSATSGGAAINSTSTGNGTVTQATAGKSFGYSDFTVEILATAKQDGVVLQNGAFLYNSRVSVKGNFEGAASANSAAALRIQGTVPAGHPGAGLGAAIANSRFDFMAECSNATGSIAPRTIQFGTLGTNQLIGCTGILDFTYGTLAFATSNLTALNAVGSFSFLGLVAGDQNLNPATIGLTHAVNWLVQAPLIYGPSLLNTTLGNLNVNTGDFFQSQLTQSITLNLASNGPCYNAAQRKTVIIQQAASGGPYTVTWPHAGSPTTTSPTVNWAGGTPPVMSAGASAVDVYYLDTYDGATWYGWASQNVS